MVLLWSAHPEVEYNAPFKLHFGIGTQADGARQRISKPVERHPYTPFFDGDMRVHLPAWVVKFRERSKGPLGVFMAATIKNRPGIHIRWP